MTEQPEKAVEDEAERVARGSGDTEADARVVRLESGVRLRTNVQAGGASERVNLTLETHAETLDDLVTQLPDYRVVLRNELENARREARRANEVDEE